MQHLFAMEYFYIILLDLNTKMAPVENASFMQHGDLSVPAAVYPYTVYYVLD